MHLSLQALLAGAIAVAAPASTEEGAARTETVAIPKCDVAAISTADAKDLAQIAADAECYARRMQSAANAQAYRLAKIRQIAAAGPLPAPGADLNLVKNIPVIPANFETGPWLQTTGISPTNGSDPLGAFRLVCQASWLKQVDPLVQPGVAKSMHLHFGWGNDALDENSTYESLRTTGSSDCQGGPLYRSAGWAPALLDGDTAIMPDYISTYYKRFPKTDPACTTMAKACVDFPAGLRFIVGRNYAVNGPAFGNVSFRCVDVTGGVKTWAEAAANCGPGKQISVSAVAPDCWDGVRVDSPDHQSHLAYSQRRDDGRTYCPATHPYLIPVYTVTIFWSIAKGDTPADWTFAMDKMMGTPAGTEFHIDYWEAQEPFVRVAWNRHCIDKRLNCSGGGMGNGQGFIEPPGFSFKEKARRVKVPKGAVLEPHIH